MKLVGDLIFVILVYGLLHAGIAFLRNTITKTIRQSVTQFGRKDVDTSQSPPLENPHLR